MHEDKGRQGWKKKNRFWQDLRTHENPIQLRAGERSWRHRLDLHSVGFCKTTNGDLCHLLVLHVCTVHGLRFRTGLSRRYMKQILWLDKTCRHCTEQRRHPAPLNVENAPSTRATTGSGTRFRASSLSSQPHLRFQDAPRHGIDLQNQHFF